MTAQEMRTSQEIKRFKDIYSKAGESGRLPWNHTQPTHFLDAVVRSRSQPGRALDIGCGSGVDSVYLASQGWQVTALDFVSEALDMTRRRAEEAGVTLTLAEADIRTWDSGDTFDLVLDAGVMHNMKRSALPHHRQRLLSWIAPEGDFILVHWERRHFFDLRPVGPRREYRHRIEAFFAPDLVEKDFYRTVRTGLPWIVGPTMAMATYWFQRASTAPSGSRTGESG